MSSVISFENKADNSNNLILPGPREQIIIQARILKERERSKLNKEEKEKIKSNRLKEKKRRREYIVTALAEATIDEARRLGVGRLIQKFDDQTLTVLQHEGMTKLVYESTKSLPYLMFDKLFLRGPLTVLRYLVLYSLLSFLVFIVGAFPAMAFFWLLSNVHIINTGADGFLKPIGYLLMDQCVTASLCTVLLLKHSRHQKRIGKKIQKLLKRKPDFLVSANMLRPRISLILAPPDES